MHHLELSRLDEQNGCKQLHIDWHQDSARWPISMEVSSLLGKLEKSLSVGIGGNFCDSHHGMLTKGKCTLSEKVRTRRLCSDELGLFRKMVGAPTGGGGRADCFECLTHKVA